MQLDENGVPFYRSMRKTEENTPQTTEGDIVPEKPAVQRSGQTESRIGRNVSGGWKPVGIRK